MKNQWTKIGLIAVAIIALWWVFIQKGCSPKFDTKPYELKIDSLENRIDSIKGENDSLEAGIQVLEETNTHLTDRVDGLKDKVWQLKDDLKDAEKALAYTPTQVDSFFMMQYPVQFASLSEDTTHLPLEVSKQVVVDVKQLGIAKEAIKFQDSTILTLDTLVKNKDQIIVDLRKKEDNYIKIDLERVEQGKNYQIQIDGLKKEVSKKNWKLKVGKFEKVIIGVAGLAAGILIK
jgi:predicted RNase H-like nuclease (RuvC/YqgF family)